MRAVILAAGVGSRLGKPFPKSLSILPNGQSIMERQIKILKKYGINEIIIVVGFKKFLIMEKFPEVYFRYNPVYYITNTAKSLLKGLEDISNDDVIWLNGDVIFEERVLDEILNNYKVLNTNIVAVNKLECGEEEVKYQLDARGNIAKLSKQLDSRKAQGEAIGINIIKSECIESFKKMLKKCSDSDYFEKGIEYLIE